MMQLIQRNWTSKQQVAGQTIVKFTIQRDGRITNVEIEKSERLLRARSDRPAGLARDAAAAAAAGQFTENDLTVHLIFRYER